MALTPRPYRSIRLAVIIRKHSYANRSQRGADPLATITQALHDYLQTGNLPPLPP